MKSPGCPGCVLEIDSEGVVKHDEECYVQQVAALKADLTVVWRASTRLLTPDQCSLLTAEEEASFGRAEALARPGGWQNDPTRPTRDTVIENRYERWVADLTNIINASMANEATDDTIAEAVADYMKQEWHKR